MGSSSSTRGCFSLRFSSCPGCRGVRPDHSLARHRLVDENGDGGIVHADRRATRRGRGRSGGAETPWPNSKRKGDGRPPQRPRRRSLSSFSQGQLPASRLAHGRRVSRRRKDDGEGKGQRGRRDVPEERRGMRGGGRTEGGECAAKMRIAKETGRA